MLASLVDILSLSSPLAFVRRYTASTDTTAATTTTSATATAAAASSSAYITIKDDNNNKRIRTRKRSLSLKNSIDNQTTKQLKEQKSKHKGKKNNKQVIMISDYYGSTGSESDAGEFSGSSNSLFQENENSSTTSEILMIASEAVALPRKRGRPPKNGLNGQRELTTAISGQSPRKRGRPPKNGLNGQRKLTTTITGQAPKKRGRPPGSRNKKTLAASAIAATNGNKAFSIATINNNKHVIKKQIFTSVDEQNHFYVKSSKQNREFESKEVKEIGSANDDIDSRNVEQSSNDEYDDDEREEVERKHEYELNLGVISNNNYNNKTLYSKVDKLEEPKRKRGRPPGSKNKKKVQQYSLGKSKIKTTTSDTIVSGGKRRGRPPKNSAINLFPSKKVSSSSIIIDDNYNSSQQHQHFLSSLFFSYNYLLS